MRDRHRVRARPGFTLVEILVACVLLGIFGTAAMRLVVSQTRFVGAEHQMRAARAVSRQSYALLVAELRSVEAMHGVVSASPSAVALRVPHASGILCGTQGGATTVSLVSTDMYGDAVTQGYAWRDALGSYTYDESVSARTLTPVDSTTCVAQGISTPSSGHVVEITPPLDPSIPIATPVFLFERVQYAFAPSSAVPGRRGLWRTALGSMSREEIGAPFDSTAGFRFFGASSDSSVAAAPPDSIRGIDLLLVSTSEQPRWGRISPERSPFRAAVYFASR